MPRPAKTPEQHRLEGTKPQTVAPTTSVYAAGRPKCPAHLSDAAKTEWRRISKMLGKRGTETEADRAALALYANVYARWVEVQRQIDDEGYRIEITLTDSNGKPYEKVVNHPLLKVVENCERQLLALLKALGLTPDSRDKIRPAKKDVPVPVDPGEEFLARRPRIVNFKKETVDENPQTTEER